MTPGKTPFDRAVHAQQTSACIQRQAQALRTLYPTVVLPLFCRVRGAVGKEKGRLKSLFSDGKWHELPFLEEPVFAQAVQLAMRLAHQGGGEVFETVSKRSSLFSLVNKSLSAGKEPKDIGMPALAFAGIPAEIYLPVP